MVEIYNLHYTKCHKSFQDISFKALHTLYEHRDMFNGLGNDANATLVKLYKHLHEALGNHKSGNSECFNKLKVRFDMALKRVDDDNLGLRKLLFFGAVIAQYFYSKEQEDAMHHIALYLERKYGEEIFV